MTHLWQMTLSEGWGNMEGKGNDSSCLCSVEIELEPACWKERPI